MRSSTRNKLWGVTLVAAFTLAGCGDYLSNRDLISPVTGDATQSNTAIQTINPWPSDANDTDINLGG